MRKAVTLIELVIVIILVGIVTVGLGDFILQVVKTYQFIDFRNEIAQEGKKGLDWMVRDIREIKDSDSINTADVSHLDFDNTRSQTIDLSLSGTEIYRSIDGGKNKYPLCDYVEKLEFEYRDSDNNVLSPLPLSAGQRKEIKSIKVNIVLNKHNREINFFSVVFPRNL